VSHRDPDRSAPDGSRRRPWGLREDEARPLFKRALEAGIHFLDTANVFSAEASEEVVGRAMQDLARREDLVLATKVHGALSAGFHVPLHRTQPAFSVIQKLVSGHYSVEVDLEPAAT
jgi:aryl-alcohol dehydrogenase (NADP+)